MTLTDAEPILTPEQKRMQRLEAQCINMMGKLGVTENIVPQLALDLVSVQKLEEFHDGKGSTVRIRPSSPNYGNCRECGRELTGGYVARGEYRRCYGCDKLEGKG